MRAAWAVRRRGLGAAPAEQRELFGRADAELRDVVAACRVKGDAVPLAQALHLSANLAVDLDQQDRARELWEESIALLRRTSEALELAHKLRHLGDLHMLCERLDEASASYDEALELYREHDGRGSLDFANALRRAALLAERRGERERALSLWRETREQYSSAGLAEGVEEAQGRVNQLETPSRGE